MGRVPNVIALALLTAACGGASPPPPTAEPSTAAPSPTPASTGSSSGPWTFTIDSSSKTTVREVLAQVRAPGDAVLNGAGVKGAFTLNVDGSFAANSKITADLTTLRSDQGQRDQFIKDNTLQTRRFPTAEFIPDKAGALPLPLPASGEFSFTLSGRMTIHGTTQTVTFDVTARRDGARLTATAKATPWKFADFGMQQPRVSSVLSIEDDIRVEIALDATETS